MRCSVRRMGRSPIRSGCTPASTAAARQVDEADHHAQDFRLPLRRTIAIGLGERRLAQDRVVDEIRAQQRQLLRRRQRILADDARHALEAHLRLEQLEQPLALCGPVRIALRLPPACERIHVGAVGLQRMDRRIKARLRSAAVERPESAHAAPRVHRDRFGKIAGRRTDRADDGDRALGARQRAHPARALVELREPRAQIGRIARLAGQFPEPARDFPQGLRPAAGRIGHERHMQSLVAKVFRHRDRRVDARFARGDRHVGRVGDDDRALHERPPGARVLRASAAHRAPPTFRCRARRSRRRR